MQQLDLLLELTAIQRLCVHDGPGIRTTLFLKGCSLACPWCCNPETKTGAPSHYLDKGQTPASFRMSDDELFCRVVADTDYFDTDGGVTFSGGEALLWGVRLVPLLKRFKEAGISVWIETALHVPLANIHTIDPYVEGYILDLKVIDRPFLLPNFQQQFVLEQNIDYIRAKIGIVRMVLIKGVTDTTENMTRLHGLVDRYGWKNIEFLQYHSLGRRKAVRLGIEQGEFECSSGDVVDSIVSQFEGSKYLKV